MNQRGSNCKSWMRILNCFSLPGTTLNMDWKWLGMPVRVNAKKAGAFNCPSAAPGWLQIGCSPRDWAKSGWYGKSVSARGTRWAMKRPRRGAAGTEELKFIWRNNRHFPELCEWGNYSMSILDRNAGPADFPVQLTNAIIRLLAMRCHRWFGAHHGDGAVRITVRFRGLLRQGADCLSLLRQVGVSMKEFLNLRRNDLRLLRMDQARPANKSARGFFGLLLVAMPLVFCAACMAPEEKSLRTESGPVHREGGEMRSVLFFERQAVSGRKLVFCFCRA